MRPPRPPLQPPAVALEPRATVKLQPDVDIDLGQQRNLDSATQAAERECRHGRSQPGMRADVTRRSSKLTATLNRPLPMAPPREAAASAESHGGERKAPRWLRARSWFGVRDRTWRYGVLVVGEEMKGLGKL
jgi:hypothetical protein